MLRVLHIIGGFAQQGLHRQMVESLRTVCSHQTVFVPVRTVGELRREPASSDDISYCFRYVLRRRHRLLFRSKVDMLQRQVKAYVALKELDLVHAHTLYSDGAVALRLRETLGLPYLVAVRNTDLRVFMRWRPDLGRLRDRILAGAARVVFISPSYEQELTERFSGSFGAALKAKSVVCPNGLSDEWFATDSSDAAESGRASPDGMLKLLYVGDFSRNKNVARLLEAGALLGRGRPLALTLVGGGGGDHARILRLLGRPEYRFAKYAGRVTDSAALRRYYREHDMLVLPSFHETFGLVLIEALSQGTPIVHSRGEGVDGYFATGTVSEAIDPRSPESIRGGIERLAARSHLIRDLCRKEAGRFRWTRIAATYGRLYDEVSGAAVDLGRGA